MAYFISLVQREYGGLSTDETFGLGSCLLAHVTGLDCWPRLLAHSFGTECCVLAQVLCLGFCPRLLTHVIVNGENSMFLVQFLAFLAKVIGLGSKLWLLAQFQWISLAHIVGPGYWPGLLARLLVHAVDPCYWQRPQILHQFF